MNQTQRKHSQLLNNFLTYIYAKYATNGKFTIQDGGKPVDNVDKEQYGVKGRTVREFIDNYIAKLIKQQSVEFNSLVAGRLKEVSPDHVNDEYKGAVWTEREQKHSAQLKRDLAIIIYAILYNKLDVNNAGKRILQQFKRYFAKERTLLVTERANRLTKIDTTGYTSWTFIANPLACPDCVPLDGKTFSIETLADKFPAHINCRCSFRLNK